MRVLPISTRLAGMLAMARTDRIGHQCGPLDLVFGGPGRTISNLKRSWEIAVLRANGHEPQWVGSKLTPESRAALRAINLHLHDLRHEAGRRLIEAGWPVHHVQEMLGHADLKQTSTYLNVTLGGLKQSMAKSDELSSRCNPVAIETEKLTRLPRNENPPELTKSLVN